MEKLSGHVEKMIDVLDESQDKLEEMAYKLLNNVDTVKNYNEKMFKLIYLMERAGSPEERTTAFQKLKDYTIQTSSAMATLVDYVHKNEEISSQQHQHIEEVKQVFDFLQCFLIDKKR